MRDESQRFEALDKVVFKGRVVIRDGVRLAFRRVAAGRQTLLLPSSALHRACAWLAYAGTEALAVFIDQRTVIGLGVSSQIGFVGALLAMSSHWLSVRAGLWTTVLSLAAYGLSLALGHAAGLRYKPVVRRRSDGSR